MARLMVKLKCPETCHVCHVKALMINTQLSVRWCYRYRRHECPKCKRRWNSYESVLDPKRLRPDRA